jgi:acyl carrier protein
MNKKEMIVLAVNNVLGTNYNIEQIKEEMSFVDDLLFDSITLIQLIVELEDVFDISMDEIEDFSFFETFKTLSNYIEEHTAD